MSRDPVGLLVTLIVVIVLLVILFKLLGIVL
jgi:hypothetical protein